MKIITALLAVVFLCSCEENNNFWGKGPMPNFGFFSFKEKETRVLVNDDVKSFKLEGYFMEIPDEEYWTPYVEFDSYSSTAKPGIHFILASNPAFVRSGENKVYCEIEIIPENITEDVQIVYQSGLTIDGKHDPDNYPDRIGKTVITLHRDSEK